MFATILLITIIVTILSTASIILRHILALMHITLPILQVLNRFAYLSNRRLSSLIKSYVPQGIRTCIYTCFSFAYYRCLVSITYTYSLLSTIVIILRRILLNLFVSEVNLSSAYSLVAMTAQDRVNSGE